MSIKAVTCGLIAAGAGGIAISIGYFNANRGNFRSFNESVMGGISPMSDRTNFPHTTPRGDSAPSSSTATVTTTVALPPTSSELVSRGNMEIREPLQNGHYSQFLPRGNNMCSD